MRLTCARARAWIVLALLCAAPALAQSPQVRAFVQPTSGVTEGQTVRLVIELSGGDNVALSPPRVTGLQNLRVVAGPSSSMSSVWTNGRFSMNSKLIYTLEPNAVGPAMVPELLVSAGSDQFRTKPIRFDVAAAPSGPPRATSGPRSAPAAADRADVFVAAELAEQSTWVGAMVPLTLYLYAAERVIDTEQTSGPSLSSFWIEDVDVDPNGEAFERVVGGKRYSVFPIKRQLLVPQAAGTFELEPWVVRIDVRARRNGDPLDLFGRSRGRSVVRKTRPLTLEVRPLPEQGRPESFGGAVGTYAVEAKLDRRDARVNDAVGLRVSVTGDGSLRSVGSPRFDPPPDLKLFDPKVVASYKVGRESMRSSKSWEWIMVPLGTGELPLPPIEFSWFDPKAGEYRVETVDAGPLVVSRGDGPRPEALSGLDLQRRDLAFIKLRRGELRSEGTRAHRGGVFAMLLLAPFLAAPLVVVLGRRRQRLLQDGGRRRARRAARRARTVLKVARQASDAERPAEVSRAFAGYVADRFDRAASGLTHDEIDRSLRAREVAEQQRERVRALLERCDRARYVPDDARANDGGSELVDEAEALIVELERAL